MICTFNHDRLKHTTQHKKPRVAVIGGGSAGIMAAHLLSDYADVHIYEKEKSVGRKFLVAGKGGFNLSHQSIKGPCSAYHSERLLAAVQRYDVDVFRSFLTEIGVETFIGTSGRVFPKPPMKPVDVLKSVLGPIADENVHTHAAFIGWSEGRPLIRENHIEYQVEADVIIFALGGASWKKTGSDGKWTKLFKDRDLDVIPFEPANCGILVPWDTAFKDRFEGMPLKNIAVSIDSSIFKGEATVTAYGLEGNAIYPLIPEIRSQLQQGLATIFLDVKPHSTVSSLIKRVERYTGKRNYKKALQISDPLYTLVKSSLSKEEFLHSETFIHRLKRLPIVVSGLRPIDESISVAGGLSMKHVDEYYAVEGLDNTFAIGEMLDWETHTGGYLLHACFAQASTLADYFKKKYIRMSPR